MSFYARIYMHIYWHSNLCKTKRLKINFEKEVSIQCVFDDVRYKVCIRLLHCDVALFRVCHMKTKNDVYFQSCQLMIRGLIYLLTIVSLWSKIEDGLRGGQLLYMYIYIVYLQNPIPSVLFLVSHFLSSFSHTLWQLFRTEISLLRLNSTKNY